MSALRPNLLASAGGVEAGVEQGQPVDPMRRAADDLERDPAAHRMAGHREAG